MFSVNELGESAMEGSFSNCAMRVALILRDLGIVSSRPVFKLSVRKAIRTQQRALGLRSCVCFHVGVAQRLVARIPYEGNECRWPQHRTAGHLPGQI